MCTSYEVETEDKCAIPIRACMPIHGVPRLGPHHDRMWCGVGWVLPLGHLEQFRNIHKNSLINIILTMCTKKLLDLIEFGLFLIQINHNGHFCYLPNGHIKC